MTELGAKCNVDLIMCTRIVFREAVAGKTIFKQRGNLSGCRHLAGGDSTDDEHEG